MEIMLVGENMMKKEALSIDKFEIKDITEAKHLIAFEEGNSSRCVFAKKIKEHSLFSLGNAEEYWTYTMVCSNPYYI